jgi:predicted PurR-regulated permease PerM
MLKPLPPPWDRFVPFVKRTFVWSVFFAVLWLLRSFFFLIFLTFVFGYIQDHWVDRLKEKIPSRRARVVLVFTCLLAILVGFGVTIGPSLVRQA